MKVVVLWENPGEQGFAKRVAALIRSHLKKRHPNVVITSYAANTFAPYQNDAEALAAEAQRLLDAQEAAFGEPVLKFPDLEDVMRQWIPPGVKLWDKHFNQIRPSERHR